LEWFAGESSHGFFENARIIFMNAPAHLSAESKQYWRRLNAEYDLTPDACILLKCALENYDQAQMVLVCQNQAWGHQRQRI